jgi:SAM-dependent methyltransferase
MKKISKKQIGEIVDDVSGSSFKNSKEYVGKAKCFYIDRYFKILNFMPQIKARDTVLEVGLAGGVLALALQKQFNLNNLFTLEHPIAANSYEKSFIKKLEQKKIELKLVNLRDGNIPWEDNFFDFIFFCDVMEHLVPSDVPIVVSELKRILKKTGLLLITTPNIASLLKRLNLLRGKNPVEFDLNLHEGATYGHIREYTMNETIEIVKRLGFEVKEKNFFMIDAYRSLPTKVENFASKIFPSIANSIEIIVGK